MSIPTSPTYLDWKGWEASQFASFDLADGLYFRQELRLAGLSSVRGLRVLEFGYGNGVFAGWVRTEGGVWIGREASPQLQQRAVQAGFAVISTDTSLSEGLHGAALDLIVAFDVLEHLEIDEIRAFLLDAKGILKPGGLLLARIPSGDSPFSGAIFRGDLTHRTLLGTSAVRQLALEAGLAVCQLRPPVLPIWGLGLSRTLRRMLLRSLQTLVYPFIKHVLVGNSEAVVTPNLVLVLKNAIQGK